MAVEATTRELVEILNKDKYFFMSLRRYIENEPTYRFFIDEAKIQPDHLRWQSHVKLSVLRQATYEWIDKKLVNEVEQKESLKKYLDTYLGYDKGIKPLDLSVDDAVKGAIELQEWAKKRLSENVGIPASRLGMEQNPCFSDLTMSFAMLLNAQKQVTDRREKFILEVILPKLKWYHKLMIKWNKKWLGQIGKQIIQKSASGISDHWGVKLYGVIYWLEGKNAVYYNKDGKNIEPFNY